MIVYDCVQGTPDWAALRAGIPTASAFDRLITPKGKISTQAERYMYELLAERMMGHPIAEFSSHWMDRGSQTEAEAVNFYEFTRDLKTAKIGFLTNDDGTVGASPDRFVGDDGLLEIKCPKDSTHASYLLKRAVETEYYPQIQGQLWVSGRKWGDILSYHPEMPEALIRIERDEEYIETLAGVVEVFSLELERQFQICVERGYVAQKSPPPRSAQDELIQALKDSLVEMKK